MTTKLLRFRLVGAPAARGEVCAPAARGEVCAPAARGEVGVLAVPSTGSGTTNTPTI